MSLQAPLLTTFAAAFVLAFLLGALANRLKISPIVGYLIAGIIVVVIVLIVLWWLLFANNGGGTPNGTNAPELPVPTVNLPQGS